ncbi:MFS transporter [Micromonospora sp. WMMD734]|uniref:MFS transporter n=1 Tax=Micromonospora sp. WMMD734 TaxID=3404129 RepID=UPI003B9382BF
MESTSAVTAGPDGPVAPRSGRVFGGNYLAFVTGTGLSSLGNAAWYIALSWTLATTVSPGLAGLLLALATMPRLAVLLYGGAVADRHSRRKVIILSDGVAALVMIAAAVTLLVGGPWWVLLLAAGAMSVTGAFFVPASAALRPQLLARDDLVRGNALYSLALRGGQAAGGPLGAYALALGGGLLVALLNAVSYGCSMIAVALTRPYATPQEQPATTGGRPGGPGTVGVRAGLRYAWRHAQLRWLLLVLFLNELSCAGVLNVGLALFARARGLDESGAGLLLTGFAIGSAAGALTLIAVPARRSAGTVFGMALVAQAALLAALAAAASLGPVVAIFVALGALLGVTASLGTSLLQTWCEPEYRGRVLAVLALVAFAAIPLGNLLIGVLFAHLGPATALLVHAAIAVTATAAFLSRPTLRRAGL